MYTSTKAALWLQVAYKAAKTSPDPSNQNGAVVVSDDFQTHYATGTNNFGKIVYDTNLLLDREEKLKYIEHAERAALFEAAKHTALKGKHLVCPWVCCTDCARAIARCGIASVVCHAPRMDTTPTRWVESVLAGHKILRAYGVKLVYFSLPVSADSIIVNGEAWSPNTFGDGQWTKVTKELIY